MPDIEFKPLPPRRAIDYFRKKGYKTTFDWEEMAKEEHAYSFTVAKVTRTDLLNDIRTAMDKAIAEGTTLKQFTDELRPTLQKKGWWGKKAIIDPKTGEERIAQLGSPRRLETIFDTNLRTSYSAGRWEQIQSVKKTRPWLRYGAILDGRERPQHRDMNGTILPVDDPFWDEWYPPNGWKCRCRVQQLSDRDLKRRGLEVTKNAPIQPKKPYYNKKTGETEWVQQGIDPGFNYNVGHGRMRGLTPPSQKHPLPVPYSGSASKIDMPVPSSKSSAIILPDGKPDDYYVDEFMKSFSTTSRKPIIFNDVIGDPLVISKDLFQSEGGKSKIKKLGRHRYMSLLAATIIDPDEIWHYWQKVPNTDKFTLRRRYLSRVDIDGKNETALAVFDVGNEGWEGITTFKPDKKNYILKQRQGTLLYRRPDKENGGT